MEWLGVMSPLQDDRIIYRKMMGKYNPDEMDVLETVADFISPLIRQHGKTSRVKRQQDGYSATYKWGPRHFICEMAEIDVDRLFRHDPDQAEFRNHDDPAHDDRKPEIPEYLVNHYLHRILAEAYNGPLVRVGRNPILVATSKDLAKILEERRGW